MKKLGKICVVMAAIVILVAVAGVAAAAEQSTIQQKNQDKVPGAGTQPGAAGLAYTRDFKVERIWITEETSGRQAPGSPVTALTTVLTKGKNYSIHCEVSFVGSFIKSDDNPCKSAGAQAYPQILLDLPGLAFIGEPMCLASNEHKTLTMAISQFLTPGTHQAKCILQINPIGTSNLNVGDTNPGNNEKSMTYTVK